jgi:uncharacterized protein (TIGR03083 family)
MEFIWADSRAAFEAAAQWFVTSAAEVGDRWELPGLGEWDVRSLVGHTSRSFVTVETYLAKPPERVDIESAPLYYAATNAIAAGPGVAQRGRDAGTALGDDPVAAVAELAERVTALVRTCSGDELLTSIAGGMRLRDYLPTRTFELVVHTCDLAVTLGLPVAPPAAASRQAIQLVTELLLDEGKAGEALLALTGRRGLAANFSVL